MKIIRLQQFNNRFYKRIGEGLKDLRVSKGLLRPAVSKTTGIPIATLTQYERDGVLPSDYRFDTLLRLYGVSADDFLRSIDIPSWDEVMGVLEHAE